MACTTDKYNYTISRYLIDIINNIENEEIDNLKISLKNFHHRCRMNQIKCNECQKIILNIAYRMIINNK